MVCKVYFFGIALAISKKINAAGYLLSLVLKGFLEFSIYCSKFYYNILIVFQKFILSLKTSKNFNANELRDMPLSLIKLCLFVTQY